MNALTRSHFLQGLLGAGAAGSFALPASAQQPAIFRGRLSHALVLSGGGARGAYQAGVVASLAASAGVSDGQPLQPYGVICGTSIGALNGWLVATGQYARLQQLWATVATQDIFRVKPEFRAIRDKNSGLATRLSQAVSLLSGLRTNVKGIFQSEPVLAWLQSNIDPRQPVLLPFAWTATNLTAQRTEYFYRVPSALPDYRRRRIMAAIRATIGPSAVLREVPDEHLHKALFASAAIPVAFDPVELPGDDGTPHQYVDGGIAANTPIGLARTVARTVQVVLLDPPFESDQYANAVEIAFGVYGTMQRRLLEDDIRAAFVQGIARVNITQILSLTPGLPLTADDAGALNVYVEQMGNTQLSYIRPRSPLPLRVASFNDEQRIREAIQLGQDAARSGFTPYTLSDFMSTRA